MSQYLSKRKKNLATHRKPPTPTVGRWKRHSHPFSIPEHGSKTESNSEIRSVSTGSKRAGHRKGNIRKSMYTQKMKGGGRGERKRGENGKRKKQDGTGNREPWKAKKGITQFGQVESSRRKETFVAGPYSLCHDCRKSRGRSHVHYLPRHLVEGAIIWSNCFDAGSVHWLRWYRCRPSVVAGESHCRCRFVVSGYREWSHGVESGAKRTFPR